MPLQAQASAIACTQPDTASIAAAFDLAAAGLLPASYPQLPPEGQVHAIPPSVLKAVGWVESGWRQFARTGTPLLSFDFGYGIMQITSGMAGAFGNVTGDIDAGTQSQIASDYRFNIAYGAQMLAAKWSATPTIGNGDPSVVEHWYYALWAYNGWGWVNNPNNPRFTRVGTPATNPSTFPYQERVLYFVTHPPLDAVGEPLWQPVPVSLPSGKLIGRDPGSIPDPKAVHTQAPPQYSAEYDLGATAASTVPRGMTAASIGVINTGTSAWPARGATAVLLTYHILKSRTPLSSGLSPFSSGVVAYGQGGTPLPHAVQPGKRVTLHPRIRGPASSGSYLVAWDLENGSGSWFSQSGVLPGAEILQVLKPGSTATPDTTPTPTPDADPLEGLRYVADTSVPDGTILQPGQPFIKAWLVMNESRTPWTSAWTLRLKSGASFGLKSQTMPATRTCRTSEVILMLHAPRRAGSYTERWQLQDPAGHPVGDRLTIVITVRSPAPRATPVPTTQPTPKPTRTSVVPTVTATPVG